MMKSFVILPLAIFLMSAPIACADELPEEVHFVSLAEEDGLTFIYQKLLLIEAFRRMGISYHVKYYPPKRCTELVNIGQADGDAQRQTKFAERNPNHIKVDAPTYSIEWRVHARVGGLKITGWESLKTGGLKAMSST